MLGFPKRRAPGDDESTEPAAAADGADDAPPSSAGDTAATSAGEPGEEIVEEQAVAAAPEQPAPGPAPALEDREEAGWRVLATAAPVIGAVVPPGVARGAAGTGLRQAGLAADGQAMGDFHLAAASLAGRSHLAVGTTRQDAYDAALDPDGRLVVAIADGLGSREQSQLGARSFCEAVATAARAEASSPQQLITIGSAAARSVAEQLGVPTRDVAFVGAVAVCGPEGTSAARVGDVSAFSLIDGVFSELFTVDASEAINVVHSALPEDDADPEVVEVPAAGALVLCTDGLAGDLRNSGQVRAWLADRWQSPSDAFWMADALRYLRRGSQDDRTAVVVHRIGD